MNIGIKQVQIQRLEHGELQIAQDDSIAIEKPVALIFNGISHVVMMATPKDLDYFAIGFSLTEQIIYSTQEIYSIEVTSNPKGFEVHIELSSRRFAELKETRRNLTGRTGCGICGSEQINQIFKAIPTLQNQAQIKLTHFPNALSYLKKVQTVGQQTGCTHAAVWLDLEGNFIAGFEDIGRHVALDKLLGFRAKQQEQQGVILISSRASYEMVQKAASCGVEILVAVSAVTSLAVDMAKQTNLTLVGFFRHEKAVIYSGHHRIVNK